MSMRNTMNAIIAESYPATHFIKDTKSDFQVMKLLTWNDFMAAENPANINELRQILVDNIEPNEYEPESRQLRRGENMIQGMISTNKRRRNLVPQSPPKSQRPVSIQDSVINEQISAEENTEGSESESPAYNPTSPPSTVESTE